MTPSAAEDLTTRSLSLTPCPVRACSQPAARSPSDSDNVLAKHSLEILNTGRERGVAGEDAALHIGDIVRRRVVLSKPLQDVCDILQSRRSGVSGADHGIRN